MKKSELLENMNSMGYPLFETTNTPDTNKILAEVIKSKELRFWEGFPILLADSMKKEEFIYKTILAYLQDKSQRSHFKYMLTMSLALFKIKYVNLPGLDELLNYSNYINENLFREIYISLKKGLILPGSLKSMSTERLIEHFDDYYVNPSRNTDKYLLVKDDHDFEYALSQVFAKKQKIIFMKKINNEKLTKTENEYYSRVIKKKVFAVANKRLHEMAVRLLMK